jgi:mycothiol system anti-sigma-R factor
MSCGNPHATDCAEVLALVYGFLDGEVDDVDRARIVQHLDECSPCFQQFGLEQVVKSLVHRSCACEQAPDRLRVQIVTRIRQVTITYRSSGPADQV